MSRGDPGCTMATFIASLPKSNPITLPSVTLPSNATTTMSRRTNMIPNFHCVSNKRCAQFRLLLEAEAASRKKSIFSMQSSADDRDLSQIAMFARVLCGWNFSKRTVRIVNRVGTGNDTRPNESIDAQFVLNFWVRQ